MSEKNFMRENGKIRATKNKMQQTKREKVASNEIKSGDIVSGIEESK